MTKISALSDIGTGVASTDTFVLVDVSDPTTPNKKIQQQNLFLLPDGTPATPALRFVSDTDVGLHRPATNTLGFVTTGSVQFSVGPSGQFATRTNNYGASGQVWTSMGSGSAPVWQTALTDLVDDTTPQLGGNLDAQSYSITTSVVDGDIKVDANASGLLKVVEYNLSRVPVVTQHDIGTAPNQVPLNGYLGTMAYQSTDYPSVGTLYLSSAYTVTTLPSGTVGLVARVTDASTPSMGATISGGGAAAALCWYNGSNWKVVGV
jgi:hypothetical protein